MVPNEAESCFTQRGAGKSSAYAEAAGGQAGWQALILARQCFEELNDFVVNEQTIIHWPLPSSGNFKRRSKSSSVANSEAGLSILVESFLR